MLRCTNQASSLMRDIFEEIFENQPLDPEESARRSMRPNLRARFYQAATVGEGPDGFRGAARRPAGAHARAATLGRAGAGAGRGAGRRMGRTEGQGRSGRDAADAARQFDHRRRGAGARSRSRPRSKNISAPICCSIAPRRRPVWSQASSSIGTRLSIGRARALGARFVLTEGIVHVAQPEAAIAAAVRAIPTGADVKRAWRLGALNVVTT